MAMGGPFRLGLSISLVEVVFTLISDPTTWSFGEGWEGPAAMPRVGLGGH